MGMPSAPAVPITIEEFNKLDLPDNRQWELHNGEIVELSFPDLIHKELQQRIADLFRQAFPNAHVLTEYPFQVETTYDERSADVGVTTKERRLASVGKHSLAGAPEIVVEVLSPSNSVSKLKQYRRLCFQNGTRIFLTVDPDDSTVEVFLDPDKPDRVLRAGDSLQFSLFGEEKTILVEAIFTGITL
jgi:Uma2 family endonuclease